MPSLLLSAASGHDEQGRILLALAFVLVGAKLLGAVVERLGQPAVLGELLVGVVLGNLALFGGPSLGALEASETFAVLAELGAILLLFDVGLESTPKEMMAVGLPATVVAVVGVVAPMALGYGVGGAPAGQDSWMTHAFLGAMLAATSVGITARVLQDAKAIRTPVRPHHPGRRGDRRRARPRGPRHHRRRHPGRVDGDDPRRHGHRGHRGGGLRLPAGGHRHRLVPLAAALPPGPRHPVDRGRAGPLPEPLLRPRLARAEGGARPHRGRLRRGSRPRGRALRGPREAGREAAPREPAPPHRPPRARVLRADGHARARGQLPEARGGGLCPPSDRGRGDRQVGLRSRRAPRRLPPDRRARHDAARRGRPHLRRHRGEPRPRRGGGGERRDLRGRRLHGGGDDHGDASAPAVVAQAGREARREGRIAVILKPGVPAAPPAGR